MARRKAFTDKDVGALEPRDRLFNFADPEMIGHYIRVMPTGSKSFVAVARDSAGKQKWLTLGTAGIIGIDEAREKARAAIQRVRQGVEEKPTSFRGVAESWLKRHVQKNRLITEPEIRRLLTKHCYPTLGDREFIGIKRRDIAALLDHIEDNSGARTADSVLAVLRSIGNWYSARDDEFVSPIVKGMRRQPQQKRDRILDDDEIRAVWEHAGRAGSFGALIKLALLTGQRREKLRTMRWEDMDDDGVWHIPSEERQKGTGGSLQLPDLALDVIRSQPRFAGNRYVFVGRGSSYLKTGAHKPKVSFDRAVPIEPWVFHDLRRCARSLMSRAGVPRDHAERVLGHVQGGVEGIYDRHDYAAEKAAALAALAALLERIINPPTDNVLPIRSAAR